MATWPNVNSTNISTQEDEYILLQNGINYVQNTSTLAGAIDQGEWVPTFDYEINTVVRGSDKRRYISIQESGPNKGGSKNPTTENTFWYNCTDVLKGAGSADNADRLDGQDGSFYRDASNLNTGTVPTSRLSDATTTNKGISRQATQQEALDGDDVDAYMPPDLVHAAFGRYGVGGTSLPFVVNLDEIDLFNGQFYYGSNTVGAPSINVGVGDIFFYGNPGNERVVVRVVEIEPFLLKIIDSYVRISSDGGLTWSEWRRDITERDKATAADVQAGTDDEKYVSPYLLQQKIDDIPSQISFNKKTDYDKPALELDGSILQASQQFYVLVDDARVTVVIGGAVTLPTLSNATDYKVYAAADGTLSAQEYDTPAPANSALIGGFHAAYSDAAINPHSIWDFAWKPATGSPRAMALSLSERVWVDIYLMDSDYGINGHSRPDAQIADGSSPPKRPIAYGGDGSATYSNLTQYIAKEMAAAAGKRLPNHDEFSDVAYGTVTGQVSGSDPVTTRYQAGLRSAIGLEQATGSMWQWGQEIWDRGSGTSGYSWYAEDTDGGGQVFAASSSGVGALFLGGNWSESGRSGPRCSIWSDEPWYSTGSISARAVSDHTKYGV